MAVRDIQLPEIGEGVTEGELVKWLVKPGDKVQPDQAIAELMTDKATVEVPTPAGGVVKELKHKEGDVIAVGAAMISLDLDGAASAGAAEAAKPDRSKQQSSIQPSSKQEASRPAVASASKPAAPAPASAGPAAISASSGSKASIAPAPARASSGGNGGGNGMEVYPPPADLRVLATPATRRLAREMGVDLNAVRGTGIAGRVTREDVTQMGTGAVSAGTPAYQAPGMAPRPAYHGPAGAAEERVPLKGIRKKIAENMQMAKHIIPHFTLMDEANVTALVKMREEIKAQAEKAGVKVTYLPFVMKALIATMREFPMFNASIDDAAGEIVYKKYFNVGFAADTPNGLLVPVVKDADRKTVAQIAREITDLSKRARDGKLQLDEMRGATVTITNIGSVGGAYATPIINHPEVAILGMYKIVDKPVFAADGSIKAVKAMNFTITADHRLIDGAVAANFLASFMRRIENPGALMLDMI